MTDTLRQTTPPRDIAGASLEGKVALLFGAGTADDGWSNGGAVAMTVAAMLGYRLKPVRAK